MRYASVQTVPYAYMHLGVTAGVDDNADDSWRVTKHRAAQKHIGDVDGNLNTAQEGVRAEHRERVK